MCMGGKAAPDPVGLRNMPTVGGVRVSDPLEIFGQSEQQLRKQKKDQRKAELKAFNQAQGFRQEVVKQKYSRPADSQDPGLGITDKAKTTNSLLGGS